jgi:hypothetical protein
MRKFKIWAASRSLDAAATYAACGRRYRGLSDADLAEKWAIAFRATVKNPARTDFRDLERDLSSEHKLRGREVPHETVAEYRDLLIAQILAEYECSRDELEGVVLGAGAVGDDLLSLRTN